MNTMQEGFVPLPEIPTISREAINSDPKEGVSKILEEGRNWFQNAHEMGCNALEINKGRSLLIDNIICTLFECAEKHFFSTHHTSPIRATVFALGGYGREEMGLYSDVDLLFLYEGETDEYIQGVTDSILYPLWDNGVNTTATTRTLSDCLSVGVDNLHMQTAMLDARFIAGDKAQAERFFAAMNGHFSNKRVRKNFIHAKLAEQAVRLKKFGDSIYLLEPNVKEGEGGLRDYHTFLWIMKAAFPKREDTSLVFSNEGAAELFQGVDFLWRVRHALHLLGNKNDRLGVGEQRAIAGSLGYTDRELNSAVEQFMQAYYRHASIVHLQSQRAIEQIVDRLFTRWQAVLQITKEEVQDPSALLDLFARAHKKSLKLDARTKEFVILNRSQTDVSKLYNPTTNKLWTKMFANPAGLYQTLTDMHECRLLKQWFPEIKPLIHQIQHDGFHFYTTDEHSIRAVKELGMLLTKNGRRQFGSSAKIIKKVKRLHVLAFATFFHDVGKGRGVNHAEAGAKLVKDIAIRLGWSDEDCETAAFLVRSHLLIPKFAYRRDIKDPHLVQRFGEIVKNEEILAMLYLMAFADVRAMGPHIWSDWKGGLLLELYYNTLSQFEGDAKRQRTFLKKLDGVYETLGGAVSKEELNAYFTSLPDRYLFKSKTEAIASHFSMASKLANAVVVTDVNQLAERGITELTIVTRDAPGLFAKIAGVLSLKGINIIDAQLYTMPDGTVLDLLWVTDLAQKPITDPAIWREVNLELEEAILGSFDVHALAKRHSKKRLLTPVLKPHDLKIEIDNDVAINETVVDIVALDRQGLLYDISRIFFDLDCTIDRAKITTHADRVIDVFYIRDTKGEKITSRERLKQIQETLRGEVL